MNDYNVPELCGNVFYVGIKDWNRKLFDALVNLPQGTSYNSYLVKGSEKTALIDTVNPGFEAELEGRISKIVPLDMIDYIVMNHAERDHAGAIPFMMQKSPGAVLVTSQKGAQVAQSYHKVPEGRIKAVREGDTIELGGKTLKFIDAPWLHWPETMFTYLVEDHILFSCDFFAAHTAFGFYDEDLEDMLVVAKRYFGEIMMPFRNMAKKALQKLKDVDIRMIAPSHGPIYKNPERIISAHHDWVSDETRRKAIVVYVSMWNSTEEMIKQMVDTLNGEGIEVCVYNLAHADTGEIAKDLVDSSAIVLGAPTVLASLHPLAINAAYLVKLLRPPLKYGVLLNSYGWSPGAVKLALEILSTVKLELVGMLEVNGPPSMEDLGKIAEIGKQLSNKLKS